MKCMQCGEALTSQRENFAYRAVGLPSITLADVMVSRCPKCGEYEVEIPAVEELHKTIAILVASKAEKLTPDEVRFLRKYLGWSGADFAATFGVDPATVSRWENGKQEMGATAERLLRLSIGRLQPLEKYPTEKLQEVATKDAKPRPMRFEKVGRAWLEADSHAPA